MTARRLSNGSLLVQLLGSGPNGEIADGLVEIDARHELYAVWDAHLRGLGE